MPEARLCYYISPDKWALRAREVRDLGNTSCYIIVGHYGSGKTEIAGNLALRFAALGHKTALADIDVVNPYFRSRERERLFKDEGIEIYSSTFADSPHEDTPGVSAGVMSCFADTSRKNVIDVGGDPAGAGVLSIYKSRLPENYELLMVVNANRYQTQDADSALEYMRAIEERCGLRVTGFVNNSHCCADTSSADVMRGERLVCYLSEKTGIPVVLSCFMESIADEIDLAALCGKAFALKLHHRPNWMSY